MCPECFLTQEVLIGEVCFFFKSCPLRKLFSPFLPPYLSSIQLMGNGSIVVCGATFKLKFRQGVLCSNCFAGNNDVKLSWNARHVTGKETIM